MNPEQYATQQSAIAAAVLNYTLTLAKYFKGPPLSSTGWLNLLNLLFPMIQQNRDRSAELARTFYDAQRKAYHPELPRHDRDLEGTEFKQFVQNMEPARAKMQVADSPSHAITQLGLQAVREVENAGRRQIIHAVHDDVALDDKMAAQKAANPKSQADDGEPLPPEQRLVRGWARVATGRETCAWCLMLVSRGPIYSTAESAGLDMDEGEAKLAAAAGSDVREQMNQWHPGCDCIVVPVYKQGSWPGRPAQERALKLWNEATRQAIAEEDSDPDRTHDAGSNRGQQFTRNQRALNALRRSLNSGVISPSDYAGAGRAQAA